MNKRKEQIKEIKATMTEYEQKWFDSLCAEFPSEDLTILVGVVKEKARQKKIQDENKIKNDKIYNGEKEKERCYNKYRDQYRASMDYDMCKIIVSIFYTSSNPEALFAFTPEELIKQYA